MVQTLTLSPAPDARAPAGCCRPVRHLGAELLLSARLEPDQLNSVLLELRPADDDADTFSVLSHCIRCADVAIQPAEVRPLGSIPMWHAGRADPSLLHSPSSLLLDCRGGQCCICSLSPAWSSGGVSLG